MDMNDKNDLRIYAKNIRKNLLLSEISFRAVEKIRACDLYKNSNNVMLYYPTKYEINLLELLCDNKNFYLPRVNGEGLDVCSYSVGDEMQKSAFGVMEPICKSEKKNILDLVIVPALMADSHNYRLGYGGGYYDRFICADFKTITVVPKELFVENLPIDKFDKEITRIILV